MNAKKRLVLLEKHTNTLIKDYGEWNPKYIMLYMHYTFNEVMPLIGRGAFLSNTYFFLETI